MSTKAIKRELLAAVAMLLVAIIALSGSTYAWFASNSTVSAGMASITAKSDAAFLEISNTISGGSVQWTNLTSVQITTTQAIELLPARYTSGSATYFETAYGSDPNSATINASTLKNVTSSALKDYVWKETVYIRAQSGSYSKLSVSSVGIEKTNEDSGLVSAGRILAVCEDKHTVQLWQSGSKISGDDYLYAEAFTTSPVAIDLYFFYDGDNTGVYTNNVTALKAIKATVGFSADKE